MWMSVVFKNFVRVAVVVGLVSACKARQSTPPPQSAELKDLQAGQAMSSPQLIDDPAIRAKKVVLVYYVNDTYAPTDDDFASVNKDALLAKLRSGIASDKTNANEKTKLGKIVTRVSDDWSGFRRTVDEDVRYLTRSVCLQNSRYDMGLIIFRNFGSDAPSIPRAGRTQDPERTLNFDYCLPGQRKEQGTLSYYAFPDFRLLAQPLSSSLVFKKAIDKVMEFFPSGGYRYVMITKSHGSRDMAVAPHLSVDVRNMPDEEVWRSVVGKAPPAGTQVAAADGQNVVGLDADKMDNPILDADKMDNPILDADKMDNPILDEIDTVLMKDQVAKSPVPLEPVGISKKEYLQMIQRVGGRDPKLGMYFPIVFMEACKSGLEYITNDPTILSRIKIDSPTEKYVGLNVQNIGLLYTSDKKGLGYQTIDFKEIFDAIGNDANDFSDALRGYLDAKARSARP